MRYLQCVFAVLFIASSQAQPVPLQKSIRAMIAP